VLDGTAPHGEGRGAREERLPSIADYVAHRAFQAGYIYGRDYTFPLPGERVTITGYKRRGIEVKAEERVMEMFTDQWYEDIIGEAKKSGVTRLLLSQKGPTRVRKERLSLLHAPQHTRWGHTGSYLLAPIIIILLQGRRNNVRSIPKEITVMRRGRKVA
jgi:hypothetical protein